ncbi:unnamed protein product [Owenia fusiformis]|uniref:BHLH domain-containing protein n=1 Tax=Owenia fusiformis TaxID=6347 RepID=A0A8S4Q118_OWEFU|nr:unnamed protein product [Owenia fusiformis]
MSNMVYMQHQDNRMQSNANMNLNVTPTKQRQSGQVLILNRSPLGAMTNSSAHPVLPAKKFRSEPVEILRCKRRPDLAKMGYRVNQQSVLRRNERERNRVKTINSTFQTLRQHLPAPSGKSKKLSKVDTLKTAIKYIHHLQDVLELQADMDTSESQCMDNMNNNTNQGHITYQDKMAMVTTYSTLRHCFEKCKRRLPNDSMMISTLMHQSVLPRMQHSHKQTM